MQRQLQQAGHSWTLPSGAKVLLAPRAYRALLRHLSSNLSFQEQLWKYHVLVSEDLEVVVMAQVKKLRSKLQVRLSDYEIFSFGDAASSFDSAWSVEASAGSGGMWFLQDEGHPATDVDIVVYRTFIEFRPHVEDIPHTATQSTSQARPGVGYGGNIVNPRTAAALIPADEAAAIVAQQEASFIEHCINSVAWGANCISTLIPCGAAALQPRSCRDEGCSPALGRATCRVSYLAAPLLQGSLEAGDAARMRRVRAAREVSSLSEGAV